MERPICSTDIDQEISYLQEEVKRINQEIKSLKEKKELCQKLKEGKK
jgi:prefoldin subunit 5